MTEVDAVPIKCVVVGDGAVGKTTLLMTHDQNVFPRDYIPTVFDNSVQLKVIQERTFELGLWDTAGEEDYDRLRPLSYANANVFLICFSLANPSSLENVKRKWYPEVSHHEPGVPIILVGTKSDLRDDAYIIKKLQERHESPPTFADALVVARDIGAYSYIECSSYSHKSIEAVFHEACRASFFKRERSRCSIC